MEASHSASLQESEVPNSIRDESVVPVTTAVAQLGPYYVLLRAPQEFKMIKAFESLALHGFLEIRASRRQPVRNLALAHRRDHLDFRYIEEQQMLSATCHRSLILGCSPHVVRGGSMPLRELF